MLTVAAAIESTLLTPSLSGRRIVLRPLRPSDIGETYLSWMNDAEITQLTGSRERRHTRSELLNYVEEKTADGRHIFLAIVLADTGRHIGNIKLGPIDPVERSAGLGILIGAKDRWGQGIAAEAIGILTEYGLGPLGLVSVTAVIYDNNVASLKAFKKAGYEVRSKDAGAVIVNNRAVDTILVECSRRLMNGALAVPEAT